jgi:hypothetical protein
MKGKILENLKNKILELFEEYKYFSVKQLKERLKLDVVDIQYMPVDVTTCVRHLKAKGLIKESDEYICHRTGHKVYTFVPRPTKKLSFRISYSKPELEEV